MFFYQLRLILESIPENPTPTLTSTPAPALETSVFEITEEQQTRNDVIPPQRELGSKAGKKNNDPRIYERCEFNGLLELPPSDPGSLFRNCTFNFK